MSQSNESEISCFVVSEKSKEKAAYLNAVITNSVDSADSGTYEDAVGFKFTNDSIEDYEFKLLDSIFNFGFEFALSQESRKRSAVLKRAFDSMSDAIVMLVGQKEDCFVSTSYAGLSFSEDDSGELICHEQHGYVTDHMSELENFMSSALH